jgi:hypothetical protein
VHGHQQRLHPAHQRQRRQEHQGGRGGGGVGGGDRVEQHREEGASGAYCPSGTHPDRYIQTGNAGKPHKLQARLLAAPVQLSRCDGCLPVIWVWELFLHLYSFLMDGCQ